MTHLYLSFNQLTHIDASALTSPNLTYICLSHNNLTSISDIQFPSSLTRLYAYYNDITYFSALNFTNPNTNSLTSLYLSGNPISNISSDAFSNLKHLTLLDMVRAQLTSLDTTTTSLPSSLKELYLSHNPLSTISGDVFTNLTHLTTLYLDNTRLTRLPLAITSLENLDTLRLNSIPSLTCSCSEAGVASWYENRTQDLKQAGHVFWLDGECVGGSGVKFFLEQLAPQCPPIS